MTGTTIGGSHRCFTRAPNFIFIIDNFVCSVVDEFVGSMFLYEVGPERDRRQPGTR